MAFFFGDTVHGKIDGVESKTVLLKTKNNLSKLPKRYWIIIGVLFAIIVAYCLVFFIPKSIQFSYASDNCVRQLVLFPGAQTLNSNEFDAEFKDTLVVAGQTVASTKLCIQPKQALEQGQVAAQLSPGGGWFAAKKFIISVPETPLARASDIVGQTISTAEPLTIQLSAADTLHRYDLQVAQKKTNCQQVDTQLACDIAELDLSQGVTYTVALYRSYNDVEYKLVEGRVETLDPLRVVKSSLKDGNTAYNKPKTFTFTFDRPVVEADVSLIATKPESGAIATSLAYEDKKLTVSIEKDLAREAKFELTINRAVGDNGSSLAKPVVIAFATSGGPKVKSVSIGSHSVARNAQAIVTFDQPVADVDIAKFARVQGATGSVQRLSSTQLAFNLQAGDCDAFSLVIDKGLKGSSSGATSKDAWKLDSRTICGYSWTIGSSVQGRPITAYSFGSGATTILVTAGIHGSEPSSTSTIQAWVAYLRAYGNTIPSDKRVVIVPNANPDGIAAGTRYNSRNVNLGRNYPTDNWAANIQTSTGLVKNGGGKTAGSEPETKALIALTRQLRPRLEISFHAQGSLVGANKYRDSVTIGNIYAGAVGYRTMYYNAEAVMGYPMTGEYEDWMGEEMNIPAILIELPSTSGNFLDSQLPALRKMLAI